MIKYITLVEAITIPGRISTISTWNINEHSKLLRVKETDTGFVFALGTTSDKGEFTESGETVEVFRHMVKQVTRSEAPRKPELKK
jgi:hypothetical protein